MNRLFHPSAAVLVLLLSACEKKTEPSGGESSHAPATKSARREREDSRSTEEAAAKSALRQALETAEKESDPAAREKALAAVAWDGIDVDRELAQRAFAGLTPGGEAARRLVGHFAMRMADDDPEAALEWARALEQTEERVDAIGRIAVVIAGSDPVRAATLAAEEVPEGLPRDRTIVQIVQRWSQAAPADAAAWVTTLPAGRARKAALLNLSNAWFASDAPAFAAWASKQEALQPEVTAAVVTSLRVIPDEATRAKRLAAFTDAAFRQRVEEELKSTPAPIPPLPVRPAGGQGK